MAAIDEGLLDREHYIYVNKHMIEQINSENKCID